jgi:hypothetical protein
MAKAITKDLVFLCAFILSACAQGTQNPEDDVPSSGGVGVSGSAGSGGESARPGGGATNGGATNGGASGMAAIAGGGNSNGGAPSAGGSTGGAPADGGASGTIGGGTNGGGTNGGSTNGGSTNGGSTNGGSTSGGNANGGSTAAGQGGRGGAGGNAAGGSAGSGSGGAPAACSSTKPETNCTCHANAGHDYWFCPTARTFDDAESKCVAAKMHLVKIASAAEDKWVNDTANAASFGEYYLGSTDASTPNTWAWLAGGTFWTGLANGTASGYAHWNAGEPNGSGPCLVVQTGFVWDDRICTDQRLYICD